MNDQPCPCLICLAAPPGQDAGIVSTIEDHGWCALRIFGNIEFAYTVGLWHTFRVPELVMFGLDGGYMQKLLNGCVAYAREHGWPEPQVPFVGVLDGFETQLRPVHESWRDAFFGTAHRFYHGWPVPVWQLVWPDANGRWPWQEQATVSSRTRQAFTWLAVEDHPAGSWRLLGHFGRDFPLRAEADSWTLTTRSIADGAVEPSTVLFDEGAFDVLDDRGHDADDLCFSYLGDLVFRHPDLGRLGDLPDGWVAVTSGPGAWRTTEISARQRAASAAGWQRADQR